jgi:DNA ligase-1
VVDLASAPSPADPSIGELFQLGRVTSLILDCEIVALEKGTGAFRPFQELAGRAKKDVRVEDVKVEVGLFAFDLMLLNGKVRLLVSSLLPAVNF